MIMIVNIRKTSESQVSILLRILTNYLQIITLTVSFSTKFPSSLTDLLIPFEPVADSPNAFLSFDCFVMDAEIKGPFPSSLFFKIFLMFWLPLILFFLTTVIWVIVRTLKPRWIPSLTRNLMISFISIVFLFHPNLAQESINLFKCAEIDDGVLKMRMDTDID